MANRMMMVGGIAEGLDARSEMRMEVDFARMRKGGSNGRPDKRCDPKEFC